MNCWFLPDKIDHDWNNRELFDPDDGSVLVGEPGCLPVIFR